ncbi:superoxide dismutase family protein [Pseudomonas sp. R5(2019)]|uniref:superoxide dismutase family protein n=1 Tax=Pseudomonas sp. R5(2019) TaxID=2697566 RepID=UPI001413767F|nr:superoxide dismutase family protein [Pseudomonas sp. R5(2019)]NBA94925.1 superoxide dismutase [Cu-Zn] SodC2 [Pseudomonas sp. R5(2019)]
MKRYRSLAFLALFCAAGAQAASKDVAIHLVSADGPPQPIGKVTVTETEHGLLFAPQLTSLGAGIHGFHVHQNGSCDAAVVDGKKVAAAAAGGHFDPAKTGKHLGPYASGHLGDLSALYVNADGSADNPVLAPRLKKLTEVEGRALMIHAGGDNHSDMPQPLGGGGARMACGVI